MMDFLLILGWIPLSVLVGYIAKERGRSMVGWSIVSIFVSPLFAFIALMVVPDRS
jgi:hypothetical protein